MRACEMLGERRPERGGDPARRPAPTFRSLPWAIRAVVGLALAPACLAPLAAFAQAPTRVRLLPGTRIDDRPRTEVQGEIISISPNAVDVQDASADKAASLPIDRIRELMFGDEPSSLRSARAILYRGDPADVVLAELAKVDAQELAGAPAVILAEMAFVKAAAVARGAMAGGDAADAAVKGLQDFVAKHPKSHHFYRAHTLLGDLLLKAGRYDEAAAAYAVLGQGPPALKVRAAAAKAGVFFARKQYADAEREYAAAAAIQTAPEDASSALEKRDAELGRARCLTRLGKAADAVQLTKGVIAATDADDRDLLARAFNTLGDAQRGLPGQEQDAIIAFLTVDLVYNSAPDSRAEALFNLVDLWEKMRNPERSRAARQDLEATYPDSPWAIMLKGGQPAG